MITYGYSVKENDDPYMKIVEAAVDGFSETLRPGAFLVDTIPSRELCCLHPHTLEMLAITVCPLIHDVNSSLTVFVVLSRPRTVRYVPDWFPGTGWKVKAKRFAELLNDMATIPYQFAKDQVVS